MRLNIALLIALAGSVGANLSLRHDPSRPNLEYLPDMVHSKAYGAYSPNPNFPDGKTLQAPVAGAIPRAARFPETAAADRGPQLFQTFCQPCHGPSGKGDGPVVARGYPAPPSLLAEKAVNLSDAQIFQILTSGQKNMPSYASQLSEKDRWRVITYLRSMQRAPQP